MNRRRSTLAGQHRPVLLDEVMTALDPQPGERVVDCTVGWGGHAAELLSRVSPTGRLLGLDLDADNLAVETHAELAEAKSANGFLAQLDGLDVLDRYRSSIRNARAQASRRRS